MMWSWSTNLIASHFYVWNKANGVLAEPFIQCDWFFFSINLLLKESRRWSTLKAEVPAESFPVGHGSLSSIALHLEICRSDGMSEVVGYENTNTRLVNG